ncbi:MAG: non-canonical purine NTP pyrophosphatase [Clostridia bacterium]|nr:non-canonical purine NTP pyrophosphatase [Clostridia bacterium]
MKQIIVASGNQGKIKEVQEIFGDEFQVVSMKELKIEIDVNEDKETFRENAIKKAETIAKELKRKNGYQDEVWVLADDSGIEVNALEDFPGVYTKRWFPGTDRERNLALIAKLEEKLAKENMDDRRVSFTTAIAVSNGRKIYCELGILEGYVVKKPRGENGFGFDEIFELENGKTLAELTDEEKNRVSARKLALSKIKTYLI